MMKKSQPKISHKTRIYSNNHQTDTELTPHKQIISRILMNYSNKNNNTNDINNNPACTRTTNNHNTACAAITA